MGHGIDFDNKAEMEAVSYGIAFLRAALAR